MKAHVCHHIKDLAPRMHNLVRLAELAELQLDEKQIDVLAEMNAFNIEGSVSRNAHSGAHGRGSTKLHAQSERGVHMVDESVAGAIRRYLQELNQRGVRADFAVVFGSQVTGRSHALSDIDLLVVSPEFDETRSREDINLLWRVAARTDSRIEPIAVGLRQYEVDDSSAIVEIARREGQKVYP